MLRKKYIKFNLVKRKKSLWLKGAGSVYVGGMHKTIGFIPTSHGFG